MVIAIIVAPFGWDKLQNKMVRPSTVADVLCGDVEQQSSLTAYPDSPVCHHKEYLLLLRGLAILC